MKLSELNWNDIITKAVITAIPLVFGYFTIQAKSERNDIDDRIDKLTTAVQRIAAKDSLRDTLQSRRIKKLEGKVRRGVRFAASDTVEVSAKRPSLVQRWWDQLFKKKEATREAQ